MSKKAKLSELHRELSEPAKDERKLDAKLETKRPKTDSSVNPIRGERGDFLKVTITLPPDLLADLKRLGIERKLKGMKDTDVSSLIRESLRELIHKEKQNLS